MQAIGTVIGATLVGALARLGAYIPQFLGGLIILIVGLILASILKALVLRLFWYLNLDKWFAKARMGKWVQLGDWPNIVGEIVRWAVVIIFLIPAVEAWGLPQVTAVLNQLLLYLPNVFVAVVVGFVGLAVANIVADVVKTATAEMGSTASDVLSSVARYALVFFTALVVLNQLGVAADLIRILFTGIVAMLALAGGLAFGLGGQDQARQVLVGLGKTVRQEKPRVLAQARAQRRNPMSQARRRTLSNRRAAR